MKAYIQEVFSNTICGWMDWGRFAAGKYKRMEGKGKTFDSSSSRRLRPKFDNAPAWAQLRAKYLRDLPQQLDGIKSILEIKDYTTIKKRAHRIKGTSGTYRLETISESAAQLERLAEGRNPDAIVATIDKVRQLVEQETRRLNSAAVSSVGGSEGNTNG